MPVLGRSSQTAQCSPRTPRQSTEEMFNAVYHFCFSVPRQTSNIVPASCLRGALLLSFAPGCLGGTPRGEILGLESVPAATARQWPALETPEMPPICSVLPTPLAPRSIAPDLDALSHQTRLGSFLEAIARAIAVPLWWGKDCNCWQLRMPRHAPPAGAPPFPVKLYPDWACSSLCIVK